jgi:hypothetical protein
MEGETNGKEEDGRERERKRERRKRRNFWGKKQ